MRIEAGDDGGLNRSFYIESIALLGLCHVSLSENQKAIEYFMEVCKPTLITPLYSSLGA